MKRKALLSNRSILVVVCLLAAATGCAETKTVPPNVELAAAGSALVKTAKPVLGAWYSPVRAYSADSEASWEEDDASAFLTAALAHGLNRYLYRINVVPQQDHQQWRGLDALLNEVDTRQADFDVWVGLEIDKVTELGDRAGTMSVLTDALTEFGNVAAQSPALKGVVLEEFNERWCQPVLETSEVDECLTPADMELLKAQAAAAGFELSVYNAAKYTGRHLVPGYVLGDPQNTTWQPLVNGGNRTDRSAHQSFAAAQFRDARVKVFSPSEYRVSFLYYDDNHHTNANAPERELEIMLFINGQYVANATGHRTSLYDLDLGPDDNVMLYEGSLAGVGGKPVEIEIRVACTGTDQICASSSSKTAYVWDLRVQRTTSGKTVQLDLSDTFTAVTSDNGLLVTTNDAYRVDDSIDSVYLTLSGAPELDVIDEVCEVAIAASLHQPDIVAMGTA